MTNEERIARMAELKAQVSALVLKYNELNQGEGKLDDIRRVDMDTEQAVNEYTGLARDACFAECIATGSPMLEAVKRLKFETIGVKDEMTGDGPVKIPVRILNEHRQRDIDLYKLHTAAGGIGADKHWVDVIQKINFLLTVDRAIGLGRDPKSFSDSYAMSAIARDIDMGKTPTSKTNILRTVQAAVTAMLGDGYKATSHDVNFLLYIYSKKSRNALKVACATHKYMRGYMAEVCHHIVTGEPYDIESKEIKTGPATRANVVDTTPAKPDAPKPADAPKAAKSAKSAKKVAPTAA